MEMKKKVKIPKDVFKVLLFCITLVWMKSIRKYIPYLIQDNDDDNCIRDGQ